MTSIVKSENNISQLVVDIDKEREFLASEEARSIMSKDNYNLYQKYVEHGCDPSDYTANPDYDSNNGLNHENVYNRITQREKESCVNYYLNSVELNHLYQCAIDDYGTPKEFWLQSEEGIGYNKKHIEQRLAVAQMYTLEQVVQLQKNGLQVTSLKKLAAPRTPKEVVPALLEEANENGTTLTTAVVDEFIDATKNGTSSLYDDVMSDNEPEPKTEYPVEVVDYDKNPDELQDADNEIIEIIDVDAETLKQRQTFNKNFQAEKEKILADVENIEIKNREIVLPEGSLYLEPEMAQKFHDLIREWAFRHNSETVRGDTITTMIADIAKFIPLAFEVPESLSLKNARLKKEAEASGKKPSGKGRPKKN